MPLLSRKVDYALVILSYLHHREGGGSAREVATRFDLSPSFCANILKELSRKGLVRGRRGVGGGYVLARPSSAVCLCELLELLGEPFQLAECNRPEDDPACRLEVDCPVRGALGEVDRRIRDVLRTVTLADLFRPGAEANPTQYGLGLALREPEGQVAV